MTVAERLSGKCVVVGVTGSIAAYKAADIVSRLVKAGAEVHATMTSRATEFITPLTLRTLSGHPVVTDMFREPTHWEVEHVALAQRADLLLIAPASANAIARLAAGLADDLLTCIALATRAPILLAPAMEEHMLDHPVTRANLAKLEGLGYEMIEPEEGRLASGAYGRGRLADPGVIVARVEERLLGIGDLSGQRVVVTAGPTREPLDAVRFLSNRSSGKMGYALAAAAARRGARVTLVSGPTSLSDPAGVEVVRVETAAQMREAVIARRREMTVFVGAAAVADFRPVEPAAGKRKKGEVGLALRLERTPDILGEVAAAGGSAVRVGFAAETENLVENARAKLAEKGLDLIVANEVGTPESGFEGDTDRAVLLWPDGREEALGLLDKRVLADRILDAVVEVLRSR
jgi:phosphopantothenoylcysteine decarboxylase/phosphopantothenate--cysteine ligase